MLATQHFDVSGMAAYKKNYIAKMDEAIQIKKLKEDGKTNEAVAILQKDSGYGLWKSYLPVQERLAAFEKGLKDTAEKNYQDSLDNTLILQIILLALSLPVLILVIYRLRQNARQKYQLFQSLNHSNRQYLFCPDESVITHSNDKVIISDLITNLQKTVDFIKNITKGDYEVQWQGIDHTNHHLNTSTLAGELILNGGKDEKGER